MVPMRVVVTYFELSGINQDGGLFEKPPLASWLSPELADGSEGGVFRYKGEESNTGLAEVSNLDLMTTFDQSPAFGCVVSSMQSGDCAENTYHLVCEAPLAYALDVCPSRLPLIPFQSVLF